MIIKTTYLGNLQTQAKHIQSGSQIITDADSRKIKVSFSSSCMMTVMEIHANKNNFTIGEVEMNTDKVMLTNPNKTR